MAPYLQRSIPFECLRGQRLSGPYGIGQLWNNACSMDCWPPTGSSKWLFSTKMASLRSLLLAMTTPLKDLHMWLGHSMHLVPIGLRFKARTLASWLSGSREEGWLFSSVKRMPIWAKFARYLPNPSPRLTPYLSELNFQKSLRVECSVVHARHRSLNASQ